MIERLIWTPIGWVIAHVAMVGVEVIGWAIDSRRTRFARLTGGDE